MEAISINISRYIKGTGVTSLCVASIICCGVGTAYGLPENNKEIVDSTIQYVEVANPKSISTVASVANIVAINVNDTEAVVVGISQNPVDISYNEIDAEIDKLSVDEDTTPNEVSVVEVSDFIPEVEAEIAEEQKEEIARQQAEEARQAEINKKIEAAKATLSTSQGGLFEISQPDSNYTNHVVAISGEDREILEKLVMGEAGNQGFEGAALVAQCLKDALVYDKYGSIAEVRKALGYSGKLQYTPNEDVIAAVSYIFDQGGYAVKHRILYFYAFKWSTSKWHESQNLIIEYGGHRVFDRWN